MPDSVYKVIELVGTSTKSWEDAAQHAVETASKSLDDLRVAEISKLDMKVENGKEVNRLSRGSRGGDQAGDDSVSPGENHHLPV